MSEMSARSQQETSSYGGDSGASSAQEADENGPAGSVEHGQAWNDNTGQGEPASDSSTSTAERAATGPVEAGENGPAEAEVPQQGQAEAPDPASPEVPHTPESVGAEPAQPGTEFPDPAGPEVPDQAGAEVPDQAGAEVPEAEPGVNDQSGTETAKTSEPANGNTPGSGAEPIASEDNSGTGSDNDNKELLPSGSDAAKQAREIGERGHQQGVSGAYEAGTDRNLAPDVTPGTKHGDGGSPHKGKSLG